MIFHLRLHEQLLPPGSRKMVWESKTDAVLCEEEEAQSCETKVEVLKHEFVCSSPTPGLVIPPGPAAGLQTRVKRYLFAKRVCVSRDHLSSCMTSSERNQSCQCRPLSSNIFSPQSCISHIPVPEVNFPKNPQAAQLPKSTHTTFPRGHPRASHCTDFHRFFFP